MDPNKIDDGATPAQDTPAAAPASVRDALLGAFAEHSDVQPKDAKPASERQEKPADKSKPGNPYKDPATGKFTTADGAAPPEAAPDKPVTESEPGVQEQAQETVSKPASDAPVSWSQEAKQEWAKLPPAIQAAVSKRESEVSDGFKKYGDVARKYEDIDRAIAPYRQFYAESGRSDAEVVNQLWQWNIGLLKDPAGTFPRLAQLFGYDLAQHAQTQASQGEQPTMDPNIQNVLKPLETRLSELASKTQTVEQMFAQARQEQAEAQLQAWAKDKPFFARVRPQMGRIMQAGLATDLDSAYRMATRADDEVFAEMQRADAEKAKAAIPKPAPDPVKAKKAAVSITGSAPNSAVLAKPKSNKTLRQDIVEAMNEARA